MSQDLALPRSFDNVPLVPANATEDKAAYFMLVKRAIDAPPRYAKVWIDHLESDVRMECSRSNTEGTISIVTGMTAPSKVMDGFG
jgi:hypothetical protein